LARAGQLAKNKVTIASKVLWKKMEGRHKILYTIDLQSTLGDKKVDGFEGPCWDSNFSGCGTQILEKTRSLLIRIARR
jgi:hypothetical protein